VSFHIAVAGVHEHSHDHAGPHGTVYHSHAHRHDSDDSHAASDPAHAHGPADTISDPPPQKSYPVKATAHEIALSYEDQDEILIGLAAPGESPARMAPDVRLTGPELLQAEEELAATVSEDPDLAADNVQSEVHRLTQMHLEDGFRAQGRRF
jgi:hypothetical protein